VEVGSASAAVAPFLAAARDADAALTAAANAVNSSYHGAVVTFEPSTVDLVAAARPSAVAAAIPAGLDPALERALLLVYSDLDSRYAALHGESCVMVGTFPVKQIDPHCFVAGHAAAVRTDGDLATVEALADTSPAPPKLPVGSPATAEPAVRAGYIEGNNEGCGSHGGFLATDPIEVHWAASPTEAGPGDSLEGDAGGVHFTATFAGAAGWTVHFLAC
jgi:hypothetical protein